MDSSTLPRVTISAAKGVPPQLYHEHAGDGSVTVTIGANRYVYVLPLATIDALMPSIKSSTSNAARLRLYNTSIKPKSTASYKVVGNDYTNLATPRTPGTTAQQLSLPGLAEKRSKLKEKLHRYKEARLQSYKEFMADLTLNPDGTYSSDMSIRIPHEAVEHGKLKIKFHEVDGDFIAPWLQLTSLEGFPSFVGMDLDISNNKLTTLDHAPGYVGGEYTCNKNQLTSLKGAPEEIYYHFSCSDNKLTTLVGSPKIIEGTFQCSRNLLTTLEGAPELCRDFYCTDNKLLKSLEHGPKTVKRNYVCYDNGRQFTKDDVAEASNVKGDIIL